MKFLKHLLLLFAMLFSFHVFSQITTKGSLILGDTTQVHKITTTSGDLFTGRVIAFNQNNLQFLYRNSELSFNLKEISLIEVITPIEASKETVEKPDPPKVEQAGMMTVQEGLDYIWHFDYKINTTDGKEILGKLTKLNEYVAILKKDGGKEIALNYGRISEITLLGKKITTNPNELTEYQRLVTTDGDRFIGQLLSFDGIDYLFLLKSGSEVKFQKSSVQFILLDGKSAPQKTMAINPAALRNYNQQRLFFSPSAFLLKKNVSEFRTMILYNTVEHGLSDNVTVGGGLFSLLVANALTGKVKVGASLNDLVHVAVGAHGALAFTAFGGDGVSLGLFYGSLAIGTSDQFINLTVGRGRSSDDNQGTTGLSLGGSYRISNNWRVYLEYFSIQDQYYSIFNENRNNIFGTMGLSWFKDQHQIDFGILASERYSDTPTAFPVVAYNYRF